MKTENILLIVLKKVGNKEVRMKVAKILAFYFGNRRHYPYDKLGTMDLFKRQIEVHKKTDPGLDMDLIIVNHDTGDTEVLDFLNQYENDNVFSGKIRILNRPRISGDFSIGSYKYAFYLLKNEYDYWFFSEDDIEPLKSNIVKDMVDMLQSDSKIGYVCALNFKNYSIHHYEEVDGYIERTHGWPPHAHGGVGLTSTKLMNEVTSGTNFFITPNILKEKNELIDENRINSSYENENHEEIHFSNIFHSHGYKLKSFSDGTNFLHIRENITL
jgi:hypothetical protein